MIVRELRRKRRIVFQLDYTDSTGRRRRHRIPRLMLIDPPEKPKALRVALEPLRRKARRYAESLQQQIHAGNPIPGLPTPPNPLTIEQAFEEDRRRPGVADRTRAWEARHAARLLKTIPGNLPVESLTAAMLNRHIATHSHQANRTVNMDLQVLRAMVNRLVRDGLLRAAPCRIRTLPDDAPNPPSRALTEGQLVALLDECQRRGIYDEVGFLANTGLRWSEFWGLRWSQADLEAGTLTLVTHKRGRAAAVRTDILPLNPAALAILQARASAVQGSSPGDETSRFSRSSSAAGGPAAAPGGRPGSASAEGPGSSLKEGPAAAPDDALIFGLEPEQRRPAWKRLKRIGGKPGQAAGQIGGGAEKTSGQIGGGDGKGLKPKGGGAGRKDGSITYERWQFRPRFKAAARAAGIPNAERLRPHDLRHTFATLLLRLPGATVPDVAALLRHRNPIVTLRVYCHPHADAARLLVNQLPNPIQFPDVRK